KKARQWKRWSSKVIPSLLHPHMQLLQISESLHERVDIPHICTCSSVHVRSLNVVCVYFECMVPYSIDICLCSPAALQLLSHKLFSCAPQA
ncbi:hypothetical protein BKA93DRAFT_695359, partial [Sparassis latifolia]